MTNIQQKMKNKKRERKDRDNCYQLGDSNIIVK